MLRWQRPVRSGRRRWRSAPAGRRRQQTAARPPPVPAWARYGAAGRGQGDGCCHTPGRVCPRSGSRPAALPVRPGTPAPARPAGRGLRPVRQQRCGNSPVPCGRFWPAAGSPQDAAPALSALRRAAPAGRCGFAGSAAGCLHLPVRQARLRRRQGRRSGCPAGCAAFAPVPPPAGRRSAPRSAGGRPRPARHKLQERSAPASPARSGHDFLGIV